MNTGAHDSGDARGLGIHSEDTSSVFASSYAEALEQTDGGLVSTTQENLRQVSFRTIKIRFRLNRYW